MGLVCVGRRQTRRRNGRRDPEDGRGLESRCRALRTHHARRARPGRRNREGARRSNISRGARGRRVPDRHLARHRVGVVAVAREGNAAANPHAGRMRKIWVRLAGAPTDVIGFGLGGQLLWISPEYDLDDGTQLMVCFSAPQNGLTAGGGASIQAAVEHRFPGAQVIDVAEHDWSADPWAKGTWMCTRPGLLSTQISALQASEGRVHFANADLANRWIGWIDGALESAGRAANAVQATGATVSQTDPRAGDTDDQQAGHLGDMADHPLDALWASARASWGCIAKPGDVLRHDPSVWDRWAPGRSTHCVLSRAGEGRGRPSRQ